MPCFRHVVVHFLLETFMIIFCGKSLQSFFFLTARLVQGAGAWSHDLWIPCTFESVDLTEVDSFFDFFFPSLY